MPSGMNLPAVNQAGAATTVSTPLPDVMGLRALRPSAAIVKVMSVPDSR